MTYTQTETGHPAQCPCASCGLRSQLRAGDRVADARTLRETGTVLDADHDRAAIVWDRNTNGYGTYARDTLQLVHRPDAYTRGLLVETATFTAHRD